jgi:hypothetical protein
MGKVGAVQPIVLGPDMSSMYYGGDGRIVGPVERPQPAKAAPGAGVRLALVADALRISAQRIRPVAPDIAWAVFAGLNLAAMRLRPAWQLG